MGVPVSFATLAIDDHIATLTLDAPADGIGRAEMESLRDACARIEGSAERIDAVVVTSAGDDWPTGWSAGALAERGQPSALLAPLGAGCDALAALPQPSVAAVGGRALSIGLELALACDIRVCSEVARFGMPETARGLVPMGGGTQRLPRAVGRAHALLLLLSGEEIDAGEAHRIGLISQIVVAGEERSAAMAIARTISARGPIATRFAKEAVRRGTELPLREGLRVELDMTVILQTTADRTEGVQAFIERREPRFTGQ